MHERAKIQRRQAALDFMNWIKTYRLCTAGFVQVDQLIKAENQRVSG